MFKSIIVFIIYFLSFLTSVVKSQNIVLDYSVNTALEVKAKLDSIKMNLADSLFVYADSNLNIGELLMQSKLKYLLCSFPNANLALNNIANATNIEELIINSSDLIDTIPDFLEHLQKIRRIDIPISCTAQNFEIICKLNSLSDLTLNEKKMCYSKILYMLKELKSLKKLTLSLDRESLEAFYQVSKDLNIDELVIFSKYSIDLNRILLKKLLKLKITNAYDLDPNASLAFQESLLELDINHFARRSAFDILYVFPHLVTVKVSLANLNFEKLDCNKIKGKLNITLGYGNLHKFRKETICCKNIAMYIEPNPWMRH